MFTIFSTLMLPSFTGGNVTDGLHYIVYQSAVWIPASTHKTNTSKSYLVPLSETKPTNLISITRHNTRESTSETEFNLDLAGSIPSRYIYQEE